MRDVLRRFRARELTGGEAIAELGLGRTRFYELYASYLAACAKRRAAFWSPAASGGNHRAPLPEAVLASLRKLLTGSHPCSYSLAASEALRRHDFAIDRATVRRWALREGIAAPGPRKKAPRPVRRWQVQHVGQLWQYDASPHRWFHGQDRHPSLLEIIDDHSRVIPGARLYERENLHSHLDFLAAAFRSHGLPLALYVDCAPPQTAPGGPTSGASAPKPKSAPISASPSAPNVSASNAPAALPSPAASTQTATSPLFSTLPLTANSPSSFSTSHPQKLPSAFDRTQIVHLCLHHHSENEDA